MSALVESSETTKEFRLPENNTDYQIKKLCNMLQNWLLLKISQ